MAKWGAAKGCGYIRPIRPRWHRASSNVVISFTIDHVTDCLPGGDRPAGVDPTGRSRWRAGQIPELVDPGLVEQAAGAGLVGGCLDHPGEVDQRDGSLREAAGAAVDPQAAAAGGP